MLDGNMRTVSVASASDQDSHRSSKGPTTSTQYEDDQCFPKRQSVTPAASSHSELCKFPTSADFGIEHDYDDEFGDQYIVPKYDFRPSARDPSRQIITAWTDQDRTATYDPTARFDPYIRPPDCIPRLKRPRPDRVLDYAKYKIKRPKTLTWQRGRLEGKRLVKVFTFTSQHGRDAMRSYGASLDNWPGPAFTFPNGEPDWDSWWNARDYVMESEFDLEGAYDLRDRTSLHLSQSDGDDVDDLTLDDLTLGHPAVRGCKACFELNHPCPLLDEGSKYPCTVCCEDGIDCELVLEPLEKARCSTCTKERIVCSYVKRPGAVGACEQCMQKGEKCIAGPKSGRTRTGPSYDMPPEADTVVGRGRQAVSCIACSSAGSWCSLKNKRAKPPCERCSNADINCVLEPLQSRTLKRTYKRKSKNNTGLGGRSHTQQAFKPAITRITIRTRIAHPVRYNYIAKPNAQSTGCHWCADLAYGILGLGELQVEVVDYHDGKGYIEVSGGHTAQGHIPSRLCTACTLDRISIIACGAHELQAISGMELFEKYGARVLDWLLPGKAAGAPFSWCAMCPNAALFRCCKSNHIDVLQGNEGKGCGLLLCEYCAVLLAGEYDGLLDNLIEKRKADMQGNGYALRADIDLLHSEGEIMRNLALSL